MKPKDYGFSDEEIKKLQLYRDEQEDGRLKIRFIALLLLAEGIPVSSIVSTIGKSGKTIERWFKQYLSKGIKSLNSFQYQPKKSFLDDRRLDEVVKYVKEEAYPSTKQIQGFIREKFQVNYSIGGVCKALKKRA